jgi:RNA polymerase sigma factor (sigma-70 family)
MGSRRSTELLGHLEALFRFGTVGGLSDTELLERFVSGRDEAGEANFRTLLARHGPMVLRVCRSVLDDPHDAEDAFQATFLALARKAGSIRKHGSLASWLHGTAQRVARKSRTAARRRLARESHLARESPVADVSGESRPTLEDREVSPILHEEIERLPANYQAPIVLCYLEGMTHDQAAFELGWPVGTVRGRLARARDILRSRLSRRGLALCAGIAATGSPSDATAAGLSAALVEATVRAALRQTLVTGLSRAAALLFNTVLRDMALARWTRLVAPMLLATVVAGSTAVFLFRSETKQAGARTALTKPGLILRPATTDLAGDPLPNGALARLGTTRFLHGSHVSNIAYSPDGAMLASSDGTLHLWDPATGRERRSAETGMVQAFAYAPDGQSIAVQALEAQDLSGAQKSRRILPVMSLYDPRSGRQIRRFEGDGTASCLAFTPDAKLLAGAIQSGPKFNITLWEVSSGRILRSMGDCAAGAITLAFSAESNVLITCVPCVRDETPRQRQQLVAAGQSPQPEESLIQLWDVATGKEIRRISLGKSRINDAALTPDGKTMATAGNDKTIRLWDIATGRELRSFPRGEAMPFGIAFSPDGTKMVCTEGLDPEFPTVGTFSPLTAQIHLWETVTGQELGHWEIDSSSRVCFSWDGKTLATAGGQVIRLWDVASGQELRPRMGHHSPVGDAAFTSNGRSIVTVGNDRTIRLWDTQTGVETRQLNGSDDALRFAALSADGKTLAAGYGFQPTRLWDVASGRQIRQFQLPGKPEAQFVSCADLSPDGKTLAVANDDRVIFWDTASGDRRAGKAESTIAPSIIKALCFGPDGKSVATIHGDWVRIWDVATGNETRRIGLPNKGPNHGFSTQGANLTYSFDGTIIAATSTRDGLIFLLDVASCRELGRLEGPESQMKALAFSPDGKILATGVAMDERFPKSALAIRLWDVAAKKELARVKAHRSSITALAFSPDGKRLLSASDDATALVWDVAALAGRTWR